MASGTWRGTVGVVKPTYGSGSLVEFIRLLPEGVGCIPLYAGIKEHSERGYLGALDSYHAKVAELAEIGVDLMHPEGGPPFMVRASYEQDIVNAGKRNKVPIFTPACAPRCDPGIKFHGVPFRDQKMNDIYPLSPTPASKFSAWKGWIRRPGKQTRFRRKRFTSI
jgi:hypothetical protein